MRHDYDFVVQLHYNVVRDVQTRAINASPLRNLALASPVSRVITQKIPRFQMKAHWDSPKLDFVGDLIRLSADVRGGVRHVIKRTNLTMEGKVYADCRPRVVAAQDDQPVVTLTAPSMLRLKLADLKLNYKGDDKPLSWIDTAIEKAILRPDLSTWLIVPLASMPPARPSIFWFRWLSTGGVTRPVRCARRCPSRFPAATPVGRPSRRRRPVWGPGRPCWLICDTAVDIHAVDLL